MPPALVTCHASNSTNSFTPKWNVICRQRSPSGQVRSGQVRLTGGGHEKHGGTETTMTLFSYLLHQCSEVPLLAMDKRA